MATRWWGPPLVAAGALLWATDAVWRSQVAARYDAAFIVFFNHALCLGVCLPLLAARWRGFVGFRRRDWLALGYIAVCGSALAMVLFTRAFATAGNYTVPILLQKLQPLFAILLARWLLGERPPRAFAAWAALAMAGAYLVSFGFQSVFSALGESAAAPVLQAVAAAAIWGGGTVAGRFLLAGGRGDFLFLTSARFTLATLALLVVVLAGGGLAPLGAAALTTDLGAFAMMALVSGLLALLVYYSGLQRTSASVATICELAFPMGAIAVNWLVLGQPLDGAQLVGAAMLLVAVTALSRPQPAPSPALAGALEGR